MEELLDSQTLDGCRTVFDYLDARRERMTAVSQIEPPVSIQVRSLNLISFLEPFQEEGTYNTQVM